MKAWRIALWGLVLAQGLKAEDMVTLPWAEFRGLYRERIEREIREALPEEEAEPAHVLEIAQFDLSVEDDFLKGRAEYGGRVLSGAPFVPLFDVSMRVEGIVEAEGCSLSRQETCFGVVAETGATFRVVLDVLIPVKLDGGVNTCDLPVPDALQQQLRLELPDNVRLLQSPGIRDASGTYHLAAHGRLALRWARDAAPGEASPPEVDAVTRIGLEGKRWTLTTYCLPRGLILSPIEIVLPPTARLHATSLGPDQVRQQDPSRYIVDLRASDARPFTLEYTLEASPNEERATFEPLAIEGNAGEDRYLVVEQPGEAELQLDDEAYDIPPRTVRTPERLSELANLPDRCLLLGEEDPVVLRVTRYAAVATPAAVLDTVEFYTSFEENGGALSVLALDVPPSVGPRLFVERIPGANVWGLTVNGEKQEVRAGADGSWVVSLDANRISRVELTFLVRAPALGLQGRIEAVLPGTGLPARRLLVGLGIPERVELLSIEGPVTPVAAEEFATAPALPGGEPHYFSAAYYEGNGMALSAYYKEPAREATAR